VLFVGVDSIFGTRPGKAIGQVLIGMPRKASVYASRSRRATANCTKKAPREPRRVLDKPESSSISGSAKARDVTTFSPREARVVASILRHAAQAEILPRFRGEMAQDIRHKTSSFDLVTDADEAAEAAIAAALQREFPGCAVVGEEAAAHDPTLLDTLSEANLAFVVDPVDGTKNFSAGLPLFGVMAAVLQRGEVIAGVILDPIRDDWAISVVGEGAWIENNAGRLINLRVAAPHRSPK
jgi:fructose-1,6-bisphosphatase/inositol monophosphatase family enzyme